MDARSALRLKQVTASPLRIAHVTATFPPYYAGTGMVCYHQARELARRGHDVTVVTGAESTGTSADPPGVTVRRLVVPFRVGNAPFMPDLRRIDGFDLIHLHYPYILGADVTAVAALARNIPLVVTHHNDLLGDGLRKTFFWTYAAWSTRFVYAQANKILLVSLDHGMRCLAAGSFRRREADVIEMPNGVDTDRFNPEVDGVFVRALFSIPLDAPVLLFVAALDRAHHFKGFFTLLDAFARVEDRRSMLLIVGDGDQKSRLAERARRLGVLDRVRFVGAVPNDRLPPYYAAADVTVLPSYPPESFGIVLVESMACGVPVVAHDIPGVRTVVDDGVTGLLANPGDVDDLARKVAALLADADQRRTMGQAGRQRVLERFAWAKLGDRLERAYYSALEGGHEAARPVTLSRGR